jgi:hypothetical protein
MRIGNKGRMRKGVGNRHDDGAVREIRADGALATGINAILWRCMERD